MPKLNTASVRRKNQTADNMYRIETIEALCDEIDLLREDLRYTERELSAMRTASKKACDAANNIIHSFAEVEAKF